MEFIYGDIGLTPLNSLVTAEAEVEGELPLPEGRRAADTEVLASRGFVSVTKCTAAQDAVVTEGRVRVQLVCRDTSYLPGEGEGAAAGLFAFSTSASFRHTAQCDGAKEGMRAEAYAEMLTTEVATGARLAFNAAVELKIAVTECAGRRTVAEVRGGDAEFLREKRRSCRVETLADFETRVRGQTSARGIERVLCTQAFVNVRSARAVSDTAFVEGTASVASLVQTDAGGLDSFTAGFPVSLEIPLSAAAEGTVFAHSVCAEAEAYVSDAGEMCMEIALRTTVYDVCDNECEVNADAYMPGAQYRAVRDSLTVLDRMEPEAVVCRVDERFDPSEGVSQGAPAVVRALWCAASPVVTSCTSGDGALRVEGVLGVSAVYEAEGGAIMRAQTQFPFEGALECALPQDAAAFARAQLTQCALSASGGKLALSADICVAVFPYAAENITILTGFEERKADVGPRSLILCYAGEGETLFCVGRRYDVPTCAIKRPTGATGEPVCGEPLIFIGRAKAAD